MLRILHKMDIPEILIIEQLTQVAPWSEDVFQRCWQAGYLSWGLEKDDRLVGFVMMSLQAGESHILNLCVHPDYQRQGFGQQLVKHALEHAKKSDAGISYLEVRRSNFHAIALYQKMGFVQIGERKLYYPGPTGREDALVFAKDLKV